MTAAAVRDRLVTLTLDEVLALRPTDDATWQQTFRLIEENHVPCAPDRWEAFLADIRRRGIVTPLIVSGDAVHSGHHRVWGAVRVGVAALPAVVTDRPGPWCWLQGQRENDWLAAAGD